MRKKPILKVEKAQSIPIRSSQNRISIFSLSFWLKEKTKIFEFSNPIYSPRETAAAINMVETLKLIAIQLDSKAHFVDLYHKSRVHFRSSSWLLSWKHADFSFHFRNSHGEIGGISKTVESNEVKRVCAVWFVWDILKNGILKRSTWYC